MKGETLINFPAGRSIKAPPSRTDSHCASKGRNYIVKNSRHPGWQGPPGKVTCDWHSVWGGEPGLADRVGKGKGKSEISLLTTTTQAPARPSGGIQRPLSHINISKRAADRTYRTIWSPPEIQNMSCPIHFQTQRKRKTALLRVGVCACRCVCVSVWVWELFYIKRKTWNVPSTPSFLVTAEQQSLFA